MDVREAYGLTILTDEPSKLALVIRPADHDPSLAVPQNLAQVMQQAGILAALNGPMFLYCRGQTQDYDVYQCGELEYAHLDRGIAVAGHHPSAGMTFSLVRGLAGFQFEVHRGNEIPAGATFAIQTYPSLVIDGRNVASPDINLDSTWRAAIGRTSDGKVAFIVGNGPLWYFAEQIVRAGIPDAGYVDGGGSTALGYRTMSGTVARIGSSERRRVPSWIVLRTASRLPTMGLAVVWGALGFLGYKLAKRYKVFRKLKRLL